MDRREYFLSMCQSTDWWVDTSGNMHVCANISLSTSCQAHCDSTILMGNSSSASVLAIGMGDLKFTLGKIVQLNNVQYVPPIKKNLVTVSFLLKDGFKLVFVSNKFVLSKYETLVGQGYECGGLFPLSLEDFYNKVLNHVGTSTDKNNVWHSRLCQLNFWLYVTAS